MAFAPYVPLRPPLRLPSMDGTKEYEIPPITMNSGARLVLSLEPDSDVVLTEAEQETILLGAAREQILADDVTDEYYQRVVYTVWTDFKVGRGAAEIIWATGGDPKAIEALTVQPDLTPSTSTGEENATPSPASPSTTKTSRPSTKRSATAPSSRGTKPSKSQPTG